MRETLYFAYGSNMSSARLATRVAGARSLGAARIDAMRPLCNKPGRDGTGKANLVADPAGTAWGVIWSLPDPAWVDLDRFESGYRRMRRRVRLGDSGGEILAHVYLWTEASPPLAPSREYWDHVRRGAIEHALPTEYRAILAALGRSGG